MQKIRFFISVSAVVAVLAVAFAASFPNSESKLKASKVYLCIDHQNSEIDLSSYIEKQSQIVDKIVVLFHFNKEGQQNIESLKESLRHLSDKLIYLYDYKMPLQSKEGYAYDLFTNALDHCSQEDLIIFLNNPVEISDKMILEALVRINKKNESIVTLMHSHSSKDPNSSVLATSYGTIKQTASSLINLKKSKVKSKISWKDFFYPIKDNPWK